MASPIEFDNSLKAEISTPRSLFDSFHEFLFSTDTKVLGKLIARTLLVEQTKDIPGDIVECGIFKGSGMVSFLKIKKWLAPNALKKVIGFDFLDTESLIKSLSGNDQMRMKELFEERDYTHDSSAEEMIKKTIEGSGFSHADYELVKGDIAESAKKFTEERPGFKISLLYLDLDLADPTYAALEHLWSRVTKGGIVAFDEYAYHQWSESQGVDKFFEDKDVAIKTLNFMCPTAYIVKK